DFRNTIIIMTSNIGSEIIMDKFQTLDNLDSAIESSKVEVLGLLRKTVRPEFINRIDDIVMFSPLTKENIKAIVKLQLAGLQKMLTAQNITIDATNEAIEFLAKRGYEPQYGARPVKRTLQKEVLNELSKEILSGKITTDSVILLDSFENHIVFRNETSDKNISLN